MVGSRLVYVEMKARRAKQHLDTLQGELDTWLKEPPYTVTRKDKLEDGFHVCRITTHPAPEIIPMLVGDFVCCLRSALDQLAWQLAHLPPRRKFTEREERNINFPTARVDDASYRNRLGLFPSAVAPEIDAVQPYHRRNAYRDDALWQLNELWTLDKHIVIPVNCSSVKVWFPIKDWQVFSRVLDDGIEVSFPLAIAWGSKVDLEPRVSVDILFGRHMGAFEIPRSRLVEIYEFVTTDVIPRFARFFP